MQDNTLSTPLASTPETAPATAVENTAAEPQIEIEDFMRVKLRVARIEAAEAVPKSSKLLKLQLDLGPLGKRQILSGIAKFYTPETLIGKKIVVVANLKPATMMGLESQGMLLAASNQELTQLIVLDPGQDMEPGSEVR